MSPRMEGTAWDADVDDAKMARIGNASLRKKEWRQAHAAKAAVAANDIWDDDDIDEETATVIAGAEERRRLSTGTAVKTAMASDPSRSPPSGNAAKAVVAANDIWDDDDIDEETATVIAGAEERRSLSTAVKMAMASDPSRSPPTRRGGFQDHPPTPKPLPQTPQPTITTPPASSRAFRSSALTLADAKAIGPWTTWTLFPNAKVHLTPRPLPMEDLSPPPLPSTPFSKALGKRKMPPSKQDLRWL